jgi:hypothetical protein
VEKWTNEFYVEEERAIRSLGKYRLAPGYDHFQVDPVTWNKWGPQRQAQHLSSFRIFMPRAFDMYKKPSCAGLKRSPHNKARRVNISEPEVFFNRVDIPDPKPQTVSPLRITKKSDKKQ